MCQLAEQQKECELALTYTEIAESVRDWTIGQTGLYHGRRGWIDVAAVSAR